jgi:hypothetical protein
MEEMGAIMGEVVIMEEVVAIMEVVIMVAVGVEGEE